MLRFNCIVIVFSIFISCLESVKAEIVQFNYAGVVTNRFNNDPQNLPNSTIFEATINVGNTVTGSFSIDTSRIAGATQNGTFSGSISQYIHLLPLQLSASINGTSFQSVGDYSVAVANNFSNNSIVPAIDALAITDGQSDSATSGTGTTISVGGVQESASLALQFTDNQATVFSSTALPSSIPLESMENRSGRIFGNRGARVYSVEFRIDSITAVPEPSSILFAGVGLAIGRIVQRVRRTGALRD